MMLLLALFHVHIMMVRQFWMVCNIASNHCSHVLTQKLLLFDLRSGKIVFGFLPLPIFVRKRIKNLHSKNVLYLRQQERDLFE